MKIIINILLAFLSIIIVTCKELPIVLWHGMGDSALDPRSMGKIIQLIKMKSPGIYVHSISIEKDINSDRNAGFFGNLNSQLKKVCKELQTIPQLQNGFNAIGFSQGGLFLRGYIQRCNLPKVKKLITLGSPHGGVSDIPGCENNSDLIKCKWMGSLLRSGAYSYYIRDHIIQAQYFKDPHQYQTYLNYNIFLPDINNELKVKNITYKANLSSLEKLILIKFEKDTILTPKNSAWFSTFEENDDKLHNLLDLKLYNEDWLGLKELNLNGALEFLSAPFEHMQFTEEYFINQILPYLIKDLKFYSKVNLNEFIIGKRNQLNIHK